MNKNIPISAGLGGGSSNAAVVLKLLSKLWNVPLPSIQDIVLLGADIPVCMDWRLQRMQGIGDNTSFIAFQGHLWILLLNNGDKIPTNLIFKDLSQNNFSDVINIPKFNDTRSLIKFLKFTRNDLEKVAIKKFPSIKVLLAHFEMTSGCLISRMSGSGSTCFGLYEKKSEAIKAKNFLLQKFPKSWIKVAKILS